MLILNLMSATNDWENCGMFKKHLFGKGSWV